MKGKLTFFGVSNFLSDLFDCALAMGLPPHRVVLNCEEARRERTKPMHVRVAALPKPPAVLHLPQFVPEKGELYFIGTTAPGRHRLVEQLRREFGCRFITLIHPAAYVSPLATVAEGAFVGAGCVVAPGAVVGEFALLNRHSSIGHDTQVGAYARVQPGATVGGHVIIGHGATVGLGANVIEERVIGENAFVAAGATVLADVPPGVMVAGIPAVIKKRYATGSGNG